MYQNPDNNMQVLQVNSLSKNYGANNALNDLCLTVTKGSTLGILGPNGSGKTTLLSIILGIRRASAGSFTWFNNKANELRNNQIGALVESPYLYPYLTVTDNLRITATARGLQDSAIAEVLAKVDLSRKQHARCSTLSHGMRQRLAIAQALLGSPEVLVLDEPTNGLDPMGIAEMRSIVKAQADDGKTIIMASHNLDEIQKVCNHVLIIQDGRDIAHGSVSTLLNQKLIAIIETSHTAEAELATATLTGSKIMERTKHSLKISINPTCTLNDINSALNEHNIPANRIEIRQPTLEEIFLDVVRKKHNDAQANS